MAAQELISFDEGHGRGSLCQAGVDAVDNSFERPSPAPTVTSGVYVAGHMTGGNAQGVLGHHNAMSQADPAGIAKLVAELTAAVRDTLPPDQAESAARDAEELQAAVCAKRPDLITVEAKARSLWARIGTAFTTASDFADRADKIARAIGADGGLIATAWAILKH